MREKATGVVPDTGFVIDAGEAIDTGTAIDEDAGVELAKDASAPDASDPQEMTEEPIGRERPTACGCSSTTSRGSA